MTAGGGKVESWHGPPGEAILRAAKNRRKKVWIAAVRFPLLDVVGIYQFPTEEKRKEFVDLVEHSGDVATTEV